MKVCFDTFGCRLNRAEALALEAGFLARGWTTTDRHADANLIVVRGCSVTARAQRDCEKHIAHLRAKYPMKRLVVTGCLKDRRNEILLRDVKPATPTRTARAYLKVQDGCNGNCAFCIVPQFRGKSAAVDFDAVLDDAKRFLDAGYRELVVTGCNLSHYLSQGRRLPELVAALAELDGGAGFRVRLGSLEPSPVALETVRAAAAHANVCRYLHIPVQSGSDRILGAMRRPYTTRDVTALVHEAERLMPGLGLGCDILTGFPDEMDYDFLATQSLLTRLPFNKYHVFPFSERPGTVAARLPNAVPREIRHARAHAIADQGETARVRFVNGFKGKTVTIVVEDERRLAGWTSEYVWCEVGEEKANAFTHARGRGARQIRRRDLVEIAVKDVHGHVLAGDPV